MNHSFNGMIKCLALMIAVSAIGCGQGFKAGSNAGSNSAQATSVNIDSEMAKATQAANDAQAAMSDAQAAIDQITDSSGNININLFTKSTASSVSSKATGILAPLIDKLQPLFDSVYNKTVAVKAQFDSARAALAVAVSKLDANDPAQAMLLAKVQTELAQIDALEAQFRDKIHVLAGKMNLAINGLDKIVNGVTSFIPGFGWLASWALDTFVMSDVKQMIYDFQAKLLAL